MLLRIINVYFLSLIFIILSHFTGGRGCWAGLELVVSVPVFVQLELETLKHFLHPISTFQFPFSPMDPCSEIQLLKGLLVICWFIFLNAGVDNGFSYRFPIIGGNQFSSHFQCSRALCRCLAILLWSSFKFFGRRCGNVASVGKQVKLCDPIWHTSGDVLVWNHYTRFRWWCCIVSLSSGISQLSAAVCTVVKWCKIGFILCVKVE